MVVYEPEEVCPPTWNVYRSDDVTQSVVLPSNFEIAGDNLNISHTQDDYDERKDLYENYSTAYTLVGAFENDA